MQASETITRADSTATEGRDGMVDGVVNLWADSVGAAARQLGVVLTLAIAVHLAGSLLFGR
jgi:hypothetical protein